MSVVVIVLLLYQFMVSPIDARRNNLAEVLTVAQRMDLYGTESSMNLPDTELVTVRRLDLANERQPYTKRYQIRYKGETMNFTLKHEDSIFSPGCMVHHFPRNRPKFLEPCSRSDCFYSGYSDSDKRSWIAANTCRGLRGIVAIGDSSLIIAPLHPEQINRNQSEVPHMVYNYISTNATWEETGDEFIAALNTSQRNKRTVDGTRYIETRVVVEPEVHRFHRNESEEYVRTIFNIASRLFEDKSFGMKIKLCLTEIHIYESFERFDVNIVPAADKTLTEFCSWIAKNATTKTDCTLLLTKVDLRYKGISSDVGLANSGYMCTQGMNCLVVEDVGPASGPIIAHEIGHLLGMKHIGDTPCKGQNGNMGVGITGPGTFQWTSCSADAARAFVSTTRAQCLLNEPVGQHASVGFNHSAPLPGVLYSKVKQCQLLLGSQARVCSDPYTSICNKLTCKKTPEHACVVYDSNILEGTDCNNKRSWCLSGRCVPMTTSHSVPPIDGGWTEWGSYGPCTRTCGGGVSLRIRRCENPPPQYGGQPCTGEHIEAKLCNMQPPCQTDFKTEQCQALAHRHNHTGDWRSIDAEGDAGCLFWCRSGYKEIEYRQNRPEGRYKDGSECDLGNDKQYGRCVEGKCKSFGCDGRLGSGVEYNQCGVCNGNPSQCHEVTGHYNRNDRDQVFQTVLTIPKDSYSVKITQGNVYCFLSAVVKGKQVLTLGVLNTRKSAIYTTDGMRIRYTSQTNTRTEKIEIEGPTTVDVEIQVYRLYNYKKYTGVTPDINYSYFLQSQGSGFDWRVRYSSCSRTCGLGYRTVDVQCIEKTSSREVDDKNCDIGTKPSEARQVCNTQHCSSTWMTSNKGPCSKTCGHNAIRNSEVHCAALYNGTLQVFLDSNCASQTKPPVVERCDIQACPAKWKPGPWSQCSKTCSEGIQRREMKCFYTNGTETNEKNCLESERLTSTQSCFQGFCDKTKYGNACTDKNGQCKVKYGKDICYGKWASWAEGHCARSCQVCSSSDSPRCGNTANICSSKYADWAAIYCPSKCSAECKDEPQCDIYKSSDGDICQQDSYKRFVDQHCRRMCKLCTPNNECTDKPIGNPCSAYGSVACVDTKYRAFMQAHCAKFCGFC